MTNLHECDDADEDKKTRRNCVESYKRVITSKMESNIKVLLLTDVQLKVLLTLSIKIYLASP